MKTDWGIRFREQ